MTRGQIAERSPIPPINEPSHVQRRRTFSHVPLHAVFATKHRESTLDPAWSNELFGYMAGVLREKQIRVWKIGGHVDHVHLLFDLPMTVAVADVMKTLKGRSAAWVGKRLEHQFRFRWQAGVAIFAVAHANLERVQRTIENQAEHHRQRTFAEEFAWFLELNGVEPREITRIVATPALGGLLQAPVSVFGRFFPGAKIFRRPSVGRLGRRKNRAEIGPIFGKNCPPCRRQIVL